MLQKWLDENETGIVPPLLKESFLSEEELRLASELLTHYSRHRHNDWSEEWIQKHLSTDKLGDYENWIADLVKLCRSHHEGYESLVGESFAPRLISRNTIVHLRYLACVLRVADVLDVDPERTPEVLFRHREISPGSILYWWKDHDLRIEVEDSTLLIYARPRSAFVEKAIRSTADLIRQELELCGHLGRERPFDRSSFRKHALPHKWEFPESVLLQVQALDDAYVYIEGSFRPNTAKLLHLLSGMQLYGDKFAAVRELLQNAFDAVKEAMALERIRWPNPHDEQRIEALRHLHRVELRLDFKDGRSWLTCHDTGVGMSRYIIENYLLVSGNSRSKELLSLERKCQAAGFALGRTGQFGLGVLSYFMLADRVEIETRRLNSFEDHEANGWTFETEGVGSFGELRKQKTAPAGTTVRLRIRPEWTVPQTKMAATIKDYLVDTLSKLPCIFGFVTSDEALLQFMPGWQAIESRLVKDSIESFANEGGLKGNLKLLSKTAPTCEPDQPQELADIIEASVRLRHEEGTLPHGLGEFRISTLFFGLENGNSAGFPLADLSGDPVLFVPKFHAHNSVLGMSADVGYYNNNEQSIIQIDWTLKSGTISVDRQSFIMTEQAETAQRWVYERAQELLGQALSAMISVYSEVNYRLVKTSVPPVNPVWCIRQSSNSTGWSPLLRPLVEESALNYSLRDAKFNLVADWDGSRIDVAPSISVNFGDTLGLAEKLVPTKLVWVKSYRLSLVPLFMPPVLRNDRSEGCTFPPKWRRLAGVRAGARGEQKVYWNPEHPISHLAGNDELPKDNEINLEMLRKNPQAFSDLEQNEALYILRYLLQKNKPFWDEFGVTGKEVLPVLWERAFGRNSSVKMLAFWDDDVLLLLLPNRVEWISSWDLILRFFLPNPGRTWRLRINAPQPSVFEQWKRRLSSLHRTMTLVRLIFQK